MTKLDEYMTRTGIRDRELAIRANVDRSVITKIRQGKTTPRLRLAVRLSKITGLRERDFLAEEAQ